MTSPPSGLRGIFTCHRKSFLLLAATSVRRVYAQMIDKCLSFSWTKAWFRCRTRALRLTSSSFLLPLVFFRRTTSAELAAEGRLDLFHTIFSAGNLERCSGQFDSLTLPFSLITPPRLSLL